MREPWRESGFRSERIPFPEISRRGWIRGIRSYPGVFLGRITQFVKKDVANVQRVSIRPSVPEAGSDVVAGFFEPPVRGLRFTELCGLVSRQLEDIARVQ